MLVAENGDPKDALKELHPYRAHAEPGEPIPFDLLIDEVLARLVEPRPDERAANVIFVVDASHALPPDDEAWGVFFQRMNEGRNVVARALAGPLLLALPERLEMLFAHAAPDFWSIRSLALGVHGRTKWAPG